MIKRSVNVIIIISLTGVFFFSNQLLFAEGKVSFSSISHKGRELYEEEKSKYPPFDKEKYQKEADEKYPLVKIGDQITITTRRNTYTGKFGGTKGTSTIIVGEKILPTVDIPPEDMIKYSTEENQKAKNAYIKKFSDLYSAQKQEFIEKLKEEIYLKYPAISETKLHSLFANITDNQKRNQYCETYKKLYESALPLTNGLEQMEKSIRDKFLKTFPELCFQDAHFWNKEEKEANEKKLREITVAKFARAQSRSLAPKSSIPIFSPDGGTFESGKEITITCATDGVVIYYTLDGSEPNELSPKYEGPIVLNKPMPVKAVAFHPEFNDSDISIMAPWAGGLYASYFEYMTFRGKTIERIDKTINVSNEPNNPIPELPSDLFSIIWAGQIIPPKTGEYEIFLTIDDGGRMWLGNNLFIGAWLEQSPTEYKSKIRLETGKKYDFKLTYTEVGGYTTHKLEWQSDSIPRQIIPQESFSPEGKYVEELKKWNKKTLQGSEEIYVNRQSMKNPGEFGGDFKLPVRGGKVRWDNLGIK